MKKIILIVCLLAVFLMPSCEAESNSNSGYENPKISEYFNNESKSDSPIYDWKFETKTDERIYGEDLSFGDEITEQFSYEEKLLMAKVVYAEARGECYKGQVGVAATILNRYYSKSDEFDNESISSVIFQPGAYAPIDDISDEEAEICMQAVESAIGGYDPTEGSTFFYNPDGIDGYQAEVREGVPYIQIGNHRFHRGFERD